MLMGTVVIGVIAWPVLETGASPGLDPSFIAGLHMGAAAGLDVGTQIVSTYGPLGFLSFTQPVYGITNAFAVIHVASVVFPLVWIFLNRSASVLPFWAALVVTYLGVQAVRWLGVPEMALALTGIIAVLALERAATGWRPSGWAVVAAGVIATVIGFGKLNTGAVVLATVAVTVAAIGGWRQLLNLAGASSATAVVIWIFSGQGIANVLPFISSSGATILGYNAAMGVDGDPSVYWMVGTAGVAIGALAYAAHEPMLTWPPRLRVAVVLVVAMVAFITLKAGFVRWHYHFVFATLVIFSIALITPRIGRKTAILAMTAMLIALLGATRTDLVTYLDPTPRAALVHVRTLLSNGELVRQNRDVLAAAYAVDESMLDRMRGASVHIGPLETSVAFAYPDLEWRPLPVYQDYAAYTPSLDDLNREFLLSSDGPRFILRRVPAAIDGRNPWFEGPSTIRAMMCRYREIEVADPWQLLERAPDRCADPVLVSRTVAHPGVPVEVPPLPDGSAMLFVRVHGLEPSILDAAWAFAFKAHEWYITRDETDVFRLVAPTASQGLVMAVTDALEYTEPYAFGQAWHSVTVSPGPRSDVPAVELELEFWAVPGLAASVDS